VLLSYASQDAQAAQRICEALCAAGIEVWFDRSELRGGDVCGTTGSVYINLINVKDDAPRVVQACERAELWRTEAD
jgi:TIR domain